MENYNIDIYSNADMKDITLEDGGDVTNDVRVTIRRGSSTQEVHKALQSISSAIIGDQIKLD